MADNGMLHRRASGDGGACGACSCGLFLAQAPGLRQSGTLRNARFLIRSLLECCEESSRELPVLQAASPLSTLCRQLLGIKKRLPSPNPHTPILSLSLHRSSHPPLAVSSPLPPFPWAILFPRIRQETPQSPRRPPLQTPTVARRWPPPAWFRAASVGPSPGNVVSGELGRYCRYREWVGEGARSGSRRVCRR